jgi:hypothetical protein
MVASVPKQVETRDRKPAEDASSTLRDLASREYLSFPEIATLDKRHKSLHCANIAPVPKAQFQSPPVPKKSILKAPPPEPSIWSTGPQLPATTRAVQKKSVRFKEPKPEVMDRPAVPADSTIYSEQELLSRPPIQTYIFKRPCPAKAPTLTGWTGTLKRYEDQGHSMKARDYNSKKPQKVGDYMKEAEFE